MAPNSHCVVVTFKAHKNTTAGPLPKTAFIFSLDESEERGVRTKERYVVPVVFAGPDRQLFMLVLKVGRGLADQVHGRRWLPVNLSAIEKATVKGTSGVPAGVLWHLFSTVQNYPGLWSALMAKLQRTGSKAYRVMEQIRAEASYDDNFFMPSD